MVQQMTLPPRVRGRWLPMTYEEFLEWADGRHGEWVDGEGTIFVGATDEHQWVVDLLHDLLLRFALTYDLGRVIQAPFGMTFWPGGPHREPDVMFLAKAHLDRWTKTGIMGPADFAVEAISDGSVERDLRDKLRQYADLGIREYLIIDPRPGHEWFGLYRLGSDGRYHLVEPDSEGRYHSDVLPGLWLRSDWFRRDPLPLAEELMVEIAPDAYEAYLARRRAGRSR